MHTAIRITTNGLAVLFACVFVLAILDDMPRWGLNLIIFALIGIALHLWQKCGKCSTRYLQKAGYDEWSKASSEIN